MDELYREIILEHWAKPQNKRLLASYDREGHVVNSLCGDGIIIRLKFSDETLIEVGFDGEGCAISQASASLLTESLKGKTRKEIRGTDQATVLELLGGEIIGARVKCALLPLEALRAALHEKA